MSFIKVPNLPEREVTDVFVSCDISKESLETLAKYGVNATLIPEHNILYSGVKSHADMQVFHLGNDSIICEENSLKPANSLFDIKNICSGKRIGGRYPEDVAYNAARVGSYLICNKRYTAPEIIITATADGLEIIDIKQGYAKCNICVISENAIITSDSGIKSALGKFPVDVLLVSDNSVKLKNFSHGFIGGATGKISPDKLAVNGNIKLHTNYKEITEFAKKYSVEIISLNNGFIEDIGSILPILAK